MPESPSKFGQQVASENNREFRCAGQQNALEADDCAESPAAAAVTSETSREFRSAVQNALGALVSEHERELAASEAELRSEVTRLRRELHTLQAKATSQGGSDEPSRALSPLSHLSPRTTASARRTLSKGQGGSDEPQPLTSAKQQWSKEREGDTWGHVDNHLDVGLFPSVESNNSQSNRLNHSRAGSDLALGWPSPSDSAEYGPAVTWSDTARTVLRRACTSQDFASSFASNTYGFEEFGIPRDSLKRRSLRSRSWVLESIIGFVIVMNTVCLGISSSLAGRDWFGWILVDVVFAGIFTLELFLKLFWHGAKSYFCGSSFRWNYFEAGLVVLAWTEVSWKVTEVPGTTSKSSLVRTLKLLRLAKLLRVLRLPVFCELLMMVNGASGSYKTLLYSMLLICIPIYSVALLLHELAGNTKAHGHGTEMFERLDQSFFTLFRCFVGGDCTAQDGKPLFVLLSDDHWGYGLLYCLVQFLMTFGLFNVISAIYVENTVSAAKFNDLVIKRQRLQDRENFAEKAQCLLNLIWQRYLELSPTELTRFKLDSMDWLRSKSSLDQEVAGRLQLSREFFEDLCGQRPFTDVLRDLDVSDDDQYDLFKTLDTEGRRSINLRDFIVGIDKLRGDARKADIVYVALRLQSLQSRLDHLDMKVTRHQTDSVALTGDLYREGVRSTRHAVATV